MFINILRLYSSGLLGHLKLFIIKQWELALYLRIYQFRDLTTYHFRKWKYLMRNAISFQWIYHIVFKSFQERNYSCWFFFFFFLPTSSCIAFKLFFMPLAQRKFPMFFLCGSLNYLLFSLPYHLFISWKFFSLHFSACLLIHCRK